ncbi:MAG TPA: orotidine-5'-phosphate decarboxylase [Persephonella sp.]|uniref:Orotidine 5'-phosphate decarboxylase n=1 Tax=Persephonella marina (strain DSM 14350 / EX-H1) TaxID=123214 RepID=C0QU51_PERMH|nr:MULTISPECIES: orotidine-5'-phosphate decarboxylase [Persephonella]ACO04876.1 orotidine 5'-phosphate decarboxylase [Persephonella marina EX-H1]HCB70167.1 orotidine-5'-phosphate decarboxylase [Persephonella sp.]
MTEKRIAVALDVRDIKEAERILEDISGYDLIVKIGYALFIKYGREITDLVKSMGFDIFLDLKLHDIPNTVYNGVSSAVDLGVNYLTVHTLGGRQMLQKAVEAREGSDLKILGVTVLTSHSEDYMDYIGSHYTIDQLALKLAKEAVDTGVDGIVSSAHEVERLKKEIKKDFISVVPGIRFSEDSTDDQKRSATPETALRSGADILVIGRPIIKAQNRKEALNKFYEVLNRC